MPEAAVDGSGHDICRQPQGQCVVRAGECGAAGGRNCLAGAGPGEDRGGHGDGRISDWRHQPRIARRPGEEVCGVGGGGQRARAYASALKKARVGLYRPWAPSIDEGWTRWILENYGFEPKSIYNADMRSADLHEPLRRDRSARHVVKAADGWIRRRRCAGPVRGRHRRRWDRESARVCARRRNADCAEQDGAAA